MNEFNIEILIIDDEKLHIDIIKRRLLNIGYSNIAISSSFRSAIEYLDNHSPDIIIVDYYLDKGHTCVELVKEALLNKDIPIIVISAFYGEEIFKEIIQIAPLDFIPKNVSEFDLEKTIKLSLSKFEDRIKNEKLKDFIFVKFNKEICKLSLDEIEYISVDGKYLVLHSGEKKFMIRSTLNNFLKRLPDNFIKVHQAYIVNFRYLTSINVEKSILKVGKTSIPFSRNHKKEILNAYYIP